MDELKTVTEGSRTYHPVPPRITSSAARKGWETKRRRVAEAEHAKVQQQVLERFAARTADQLAERMLEHTGVAVEYAAKVVAGTEKGDSIRLKAAGLLLMQGHAAAPKRILQASLSLKAVLERPDEDLLQVALQALPTDRLNAVRLTPAYAGQPPASVSESGR